MEKMTLEEMIKHERERRFEEGNFGILACKDSIKFEVEYFKKNLFELLEQYYNRANESVFFNRQMVLACWEMINEKGGNK